MVLLLRICVTMVTIACAFGQFDASFPQRKTWWAKRITDDYYTAGRLSARQIKYAAEDGFKSIISIFNFTAPVETDLESFPTTTESKVIAEDLCGLQYAVVLSPGDNWQDVRLVEQFTAIVERMPKPVLLHCGVGFSSTFTLLNYFANRTRQDPDFTPQITADNFFDIGSSHGFDYSDGKLKSIVTEVTGTSLTMVNVTKPDIPLGQGWWYYWHCRPAFKDIFVAGQIYSSTILTINQTGFRSVINNRRGLTLQSGDPSQEEVTLLNIKDRTGTYSNGGRQSRERLEATRIDPNKPNEYIKAGSTVNYEMTNELEFGDAIGYNEQTEKTAIEGAGMKYYSHPIGDQYTYNRETWDAMKDDLREAIARGPTLFHCRRTYRGAVWALLAAADYYNLNSTWAIGRSREMGFSYVTSGPEVKLWQAVLDGGDDSSSTNVHHQSVLLLVFTLLGLCLCHFISH